MRGDQQKLLNQYQHGTAANIHYSSYFQNNSDKYINGQETDEIWRIPSHTILNLQDSYIY